MQLAHAVAMLADRGVPHTPHLLRGTSAGLHAPLELVADPPSAPGAIRNPADYDAVLQGMIGVVNDPKGTAYAAGIGKGFPFVIAGKTGTAERYSRKTDEWTDTKDRAILAARHRAWFICFTPADSPRIAVAVVLEAGAWGGSDAAPIARKMLDAWLAEQPASALPPATVTASAGNPSVKPEASQ
jgi:penicillin-binding protein 2